MPALTAEPACQVADVEQRDELCPAEDSAGVRCERRDPHGPDGHRITEHTQRHALAGNGYTCDSIGGTR